MVQPPEPVEDRALVLMREALRLLDYEGRNLAACHLSLAIETALKSSEVAWLRRISIGE